MQDSTQKAAGAASDLSKELEPTTKLWSIYIPAIDLSFAMQDKETAEKECAEYDKNIREYYKDKKPVAFDLDEAFGLVQKWPHSDEMHKEDLAIKSWQMYE